MTKMGSLALGALLLGLSARAADVQKGYSFSDGNRVFASQLNSLVDSATILPGFYTSRTAQTNLATSDVFLVLAGPAYTTYKRVSATYALYQNTSIITGRAEKTDVESTDYLLLYDATEQVFKKVSASNLSLTTTNLVAGQPLATNVSLNSYLLVLNYGTNSRVTLSNLLAMFNYRALYTNLTLHTAPTNADRLLIWDSINNSNKAITLSGFITNLPPASAVTNSDVFAALTSNGVVSKVTFQQLQTAISNNIVAPVVTGFSTPEMTLTVGVLTNGAHGLGLKPSSVRGVLVCKAIDWGYSVGDEIDAGNMWNNGATFTFGANATNVFASLSKNSGDICDKTNGVQRNMTLPSWKFKLYATP